MTNPKIDIYDREILRCLLKAKRPLNTNEISNFKKIGYMTVRKHLKYLEGIGYVKKVRLDWQKDNDKRTFWVSN